MTNETTKKHTLMIVDDEPDNLDALERVFRKDYRIIKATSGVEALKLLNNEKVTVIISDQRMPMMTGVEFLKQSLKTHPETIRILLTGYTDIESVIAAINSGQIYRYVTKPWDSNDLQTAVRQAVDKYELTAELSIKNRELQKAYEELQTLDKAKDQFMVLINHELKTPLTTLISFKDLLAETSLDQDQKKYLDRMVASIEKIQLIISDVLELVSAESGHLKLSSKSISLKKIIDETTSELQSLIENNGVTVETDIEETEIQGDEAAIKKVVYQLLKNAVQFCDSQSVISISTKKKSGKTEVNIENFGPTLSRKVLNDLLKPFHLNEEMMNHSKGLGLGLSISRALLKLHDSELKLKSKDDKFTASFKI